MRCVAQGAACYCGLGIIGPADCPEAADTCPSAWYTEDDYKRLKPIQTITLGFNQSVYVSELEIYMPRGGSALVEVLAYDDEFDTFSSIYVADSCQVRQALVNRKDAKYNIVFVTPCRTIFKTSVIKLVFDTGFSKQQLMVDAVRLSGTLDVPVGAVTSRSRSLVYVPDANAFGIDDFQYIVTDCPFKDERSSDPSRITVPISGVTDPPYIPITTFRVSSACFPAMSCV